LALENNAGFLVEKSAGEKPRIKDRQYAAFFKNLSFCFSVHYGRKIFSFFD
jgi:hypothetical protein